MSTRPAKVGQRPPTARRSSTRTKDAPAEKRQYRAILFWTVVLAFLIHASSLANGFVYFDDPENVMDNFSIREINLANIGHWFTTPLQFMYTPLVYVSYAVDYLIGGGAAGMYHFTNLALHLCNVVLVFALVHALTRRVFVAHVVAALFAIHPVNVDSIAWISTRSNLLATLFSLAALLLYTRYLRSASWRQLAWATALFALATLSKSSAVVLPLLLFLIDYFHGRRPSWRMLLEKIPMFAIAVGMGLVGLHFRGDVVAAGYTLVERGFLICTALVAYLLRLVFPFNLSLVYAYPGTAGHLPWYVYASPVILIAVTVLLLLVRSARKVVIFGLAFFVVNVALSQVVLLIDNYQANRYAYLGYIGLFLIVAHFVDRALHARVSREAAPRLREALPRLRIALTSVLVVFAVVLVTLTVIRTVAWRNTVTIMSDAIAKEPGVPFVYNSRGIAEYRDGDYAAAKRDFEETIRIDPDFLLARHYLGILKYNAGDYAGSLADHDQVLARLQTFAAGFNERGRTKLALKDYSGAFTDFSTAIQYDPYLVDAYNNRGIADIELGNPTAALADLDRAISLFPDFADAYYERGVARSRLNDTSGACTDWSKASSLGHQEAPQVMTDQHCPA